MTTTPELRLRMAKDIINFEARRDKQGHLVVYQLPANDGGGRYEVAGINEKYDKEQVDHLVYLLNAGKFDEAETYAEEYIASNTDVAAKWTDVPCIESYLRDIVFNRGEGGALRTLRHALDLRDLSVFGDAGPAMRKAEQQPQELLARLRESREWYEKNIVGFRPNFWHGLVNRWDNSLEAAKKFPDKPVVPVVVKPPPLTPAQKGGAAVGVLAVVVMAAQTINQHPIITILVAGAVIAAVAYGIRCLRN
jgi:hypothetical protein